MPLPCSKSKADALGKRLCSGEPISDDDRALLRQIIGAYDEPLNTVIAKLDGLGFSAVGRLKTEGTLLEKVAHSRLSTIRDVAGARIVLERIEYMYALETQDAVVRRIQQHWPNSKLIDRRSNPSFGYRAVHIEATELDLPVEIQVRTKLQHFWAEAYERFGDYLGRQIRYGAPPTNPNALYSGAVTNSEVVILMHDFSSMIAQVEEAGRDAQWAWERVDELTAEAQALSQDDGDQHGIDQLIDESESVRTIALEAESVVYKALSKITQLGAILSGESSDADERT